MWSCFSLGDQKSGLHGERLVCDIPHVLGFIEVTVCLLGYKRQT